MPITINSAKAGMRGNAGGIGTKTVDPRAIKNAPNKNVPNKNAPNKNVGAGGDATGTGHDDDDAIAAFFQEIKVDDADKYHEIRKVSAVPGLQMFRLGPEYIDEEYFECTPVPLYQQSIPILNYDEFLDKPADEILVITPIRPQTFSALFAFYKDRGPALNWDPNLTDLEEDCFFQEVINFPTSKLAYSLPREKKRDLVKKKRVKVFHPGGEFTVKTRLYVNLQESHTYVLLEITGSLVLESEKDKFALTILKNEKYLKMVKHHLESDSYANDYAQSFENYKLSKHSDYKIRGCSDIGTDCHFYFIEDEYKRVDADDIKRKIRENDELTARMLAEKAHLDIPETGWKSSDEDSSDEEADMNAFTVDISKYREEEEEDSRQEIMEDASEDEVPLSSEDDEEFEINYPLHNVYERKSNQAKHKGPRIYPDISFSMIALERIICMDSEQQKQADMRGFGEPEEIKIEIVAQEDETEKEPEMDEDAVVNLLIQQHRLQEQSERPEDEDGKQDEVIIPPEITQAELEKLKEDLEDGDIKDGDPIEIKIELPVITKKESFKIEEPIVQEVPEEKDEFDLAFEGLLVEDKVDGTDKTESGGTGTRKDRVEGPSDDYQDSTGKDTRRADDDSTGGGLDKFDKLGSVAQGTLKIGVEDNKFSEIKCEWDNRSERDADSKDQLEEEKQTEEIIEEEKLDLLQASEEGEDLLAKITSHKERGGSGGIKKEVVQLNGHQVLELVPDPKPDEEAKRKDKEKVEAEEVDDISDVSEIEEDSRLSDHKGLDEDGDESSTSSEEETTQTKNGVNRSSSPSVVFGKDVILIENETSEASGPSLRQYWYYKTQQTFGHEVTDIAIHPTNGNIFAVSYGSFRFGKNGEEGMICVWNAKNSRSPERTYQLRSPGTALAFSEFTPYVLAVGTLDGNIVLFDVRDSDCVILGNTFAQHDKHMGPVWQICWVEEEDTSNDDSITESMLSLGDDGYLKRWSLTKGMESSIAMKVMRSTMQIPGRREKRSESLITTLSTAYTVCFLPKNTDQFLLGTEEGFIHKCATAYKDQFVSTFIGHTGPVYRIIFSPFDENVFISCGGDWTVKIWNTDRPIPLISLQTGHRTIFDVACSLHSSTVFICCTEFCIEVWDLSQNTLEPVVQYHPAFDIGLRKAAFNGLLNSVLIGDDDGGLSIYGLRFFPAPPTTPQGQNIALMEAVFPGYQRRMKDDENNVMEPSAQLSARRISKQSTSINKIEDDGRKSIKPRNI